MGPNSKQHAGRSRVAAGRLGATGGWRLAARLSLEWLRVGGKDDNLRVS